MGTSQDAELDRAAEVIAGAPALALACHVNPDGDALGSLLAFHLLCRANGTASVASWAEPLDPGPQYRFLPGLELATKPADFPAEPAVMVCFDCGAPGRLGELRGSASAAGTLVVVDHHASNTGFGHVNLLDPGAAATVVLVRRLAERLGWALDRDVATCLYTGLVTDTGRFQYDCTTPAVFALAQELAAFELPVAAISRQLFDQHRFAYLQLVAEALRRAVLDRDLRLVSTWVTAEDLDRFDCDLAETEGLIDVLRGAAEAEVTCVLKEAHDGVRVSLRSVSAFDVSAVAARFGGGGHRHAAAFVARRGGVAEVLAAVRAEVAAAG